MKTRLAISTFALSAVLATPSFADVSAADVWSNQQAFYDAMGVTLSGELSGSQLTNPELNIILPQGVASMQIKTDAILITEGSDGSVTLSYPSPMTVSMAGGAEGEGSFTADVVLTHDGYTIVATGDPGDITYVTEVQNMQMVVGDVTLEGGDVTDLSVEGNVTLTTYRSTARVTEGNVISYEASSEIGESDGAFTFEADNITSKNTQTAAPMQTNVTATFPVGGSDLMNLSQAFRNGLSIALESTGGGNSSTAITTVDGNVLSRQNSTTGEQTATMTIGEDGFTANVQASGFDGVFYEQLLFPGDIEFSMETISADYNIPLNASEDAQDFRVATSLQGIVLGDTIWNLIDPAGQLPRDPAEVSFDVTGTGTNGMDLLDFAAMSQLYGPPPVEVDDVTIENLRVAAVGAELTAQGAFTFDWTDFQTIPGIARPEGSVTINLNGANQLLETLSSMGLIPEEELMMPRMMMGMFATPVGDDMLESVIEVNDQGHILANGQRLQ